MPTVTRYLGFTPGVQRLTWSGPPGTITAHLWGGGGGAGGADSAPGGAGGGGGYSTYTCNVVDGDVIDVAVGGAGGTGASAAGGAPGGVGGASYVDIGLVFDTRTAVTTPPVYPYTNPAWCSFLNTYGVWNAVATSYEFTRNYSVNFPNSGSYTLTFSTDDYGDVSIDGVNVINSYSYRTSVQQTVFVTSGTHTVTVHGVNSGGGPAAVGLTISGGSSYSGGGGSAAGPVPFSGAGGGGGGATILMVNDSVVCIAAGGGGGGGGGNQSPGQSVPGVISQAALGITNGQNGEPKYGDGGGAGGGGGGYGAGNGGNVRSGDQGGLAGSYGIGLGATLNPSGAVPGGTNVSYYKGGTARGAPIGGYATSGAAAIVITVSGTSVYNYGEFTTVQTTYVNQGGTWKPVKGIFLRDETGWIPIPGSVTPNFDVVPGNIGVSSRPWA